MRQAKLFALQYKDFFKGLVVTVGSVILTGVMTSLNTGALPTSADFKTLAIAGASGGVAYLLKNFFTNSNDQMFKGEQPK